MARAILTEREPVGGGLQRVRLAVDAEVAATHSRHAQYIELVETRGDGDARGYFVIASSPGERTWDLVVRDGGSMGDRLHQAPLGTVFEVSSAQGSGFPVEAAVGKPLVLAVTGSGIAAVLSTIGDRIERGDAQRTFLLYGVRERSDVALSPELDAMRNAGVDVAICLSREHVDEPGFYRGYVQDVAAQRGWNVRGGRAFVAGNEAMIEGMRKAAATLGLRADEVHLNA